MNEWVDRLRAGDGEALAWCFRTHAAALLTLAVRLLGERADAEDVVQDVFIGLPAAMMRYEEQGEFAAWLRQRTVRMALTRARSARRRREVPHAGESLARLADGGSVDDRGLLVERALRSLSAPLRQVFVLRVLEGHSHRAIADLLGISVGASEVRLTRALKALRGLLGDQR